MNVSWRGPAGCVRCMCVKPCGKETANRDYSTSISSNRCKDERARPNSAVSNNSDYFPRQAKSL